MTKLSLYSNKAPFPYFGGKREVAAEVWRRFGNVPNYIEPFFGSGAVLLARPHIPGTETVNDADCYLSNFWRAIQHAPEETAKHADWPVNEADLHARHIWLVKSPEAQAFREQMKTVPDYYDAKIAGWWCWGLCCWIGGEWCKAPREQLPHLGDAGMGIHDYFVTLADRLRGVRVACGNWDRITGESVTIRHGVTGVFLDPPYGDDADCAELYATESRTVARDAQKWAVANGTNPLYRIALCGYDGQYEMPASWRVYAWKARGGFGSQGNGRGRANCRRERIWFSPHCIDDGLFEEDGR